MELPATEAQAVAQNLLVEQRPPAPFVPRDGLPLGLLVAPAELGDAKGRDGCILHEQLPAVVATPGLLGEIALRQMRVPCTAL